MGIKLEKAHCVQAQKFFELLIKTTDKQVNLFTCQAEIKLNNLYNGEFDPGSGRTLAAGLTHASRTVTFLACEKMTSGARVRNAYATYLTQGDSPKKFGLIPHGTIKLHGLLVKALWCKMGMRLISQLVR